MGKATRARRQEDDLGAPPAAQLANCRFATVQIKDPEAAAPRLARRALSTRQLERLLHREAIDQRQYEAGDRYRTDWERAGFDPKVTGCYDIVTAGGQAGHYQARGGQTLAQMDAHNRWRAARAELDPALVHGFDSVIVHDQQWAEVGAERDRLGAFTRDSWRLAITLCLERLAAHYKM